MKCAGAGLDGPTAGLKVTGWKPAVLGEEAGVHTFQVGGEIPAELMPIWEARSSLWAQHRPWGHAFIKHG